MSGFAKSEMQANQAVRAVLPARALDDLNWMRGLAAVAVLAGHVRGVFFVDYESVRHSPLLGASYVLTGLGHQAVVVFFVLSGFFIGSSVAVTTADASWDWTRYVVRRLSRLYVVIVPALALTALWDVAGMRAWGTGSIYGGNVVARSLTLPVVPETLTFPVLMGNLAFLQELVVAPFGSNGPLWSLSYEAWAYVVFPLLFRAGFGSEQRATRIAAGAAAVGILGVAGSLFRFYFCVWCLGAIVATTWTRRAFPRIGSAPAIVAVGGFVVALLAARLRLLGSRAGEDFSLGLATACLVASRLARHAGMPGAAPISAVRREYSRWGDVLAGFSFTLYATHYPVVTFFQAWLVGRQRWLPSVPHAVVATAFGIAVIVFYSYPLSRATEARTDAVRRWVERFLRRPSPAVGGAP